jgi:hypothetical protein
LAFSHFPLKIPQKKLVFICVFMAHQGLDFRRLVVLKEAHFPLWQFPSIDGIGPYGDEDCLLFGNDCLKEIGWTKMELGTNNMDKIGDSRFLPMESDSADENIGLFS